MNSDSDSYLFNSEGYDLEQYNIDPPSAQIHKYILKKRTNNLKVNGLVCNIYIENTVQKNGKTYY